MAQKSFSNLRLSGSSPDAPWEVCITAHQGRLGGVGGDSMVQEGVSQLAFPHDMAARWPSGWQLFGDIFPLTGCSLRHRKQNLYQGQISTTISTRIKDKSLLGSLLQISTRISTRIESICQLSHRSRQKVCFTSKSLSDFQSHEYIHHLLQSHCSSCFHRVRRSPLFPSVHCLAKPHFDLKQCNAR